MRDWRLFVGAVFWLCSPASAQNCVIDVVTQEVVCPQADELPHGGRRTYELLFARILEIRATNAWHSQDISSSKGSLGALLMGVIASFWVCSQIATNLCRIESVQRRVCSFRNLRPARIWAGSGNFLWAALRIHNRSPLQRRWKASSGPKAGSCPP